MRYNLELGTSEEHMGIVHVLPKDDLLQGVKNNEYMRILKMVLQNSLVNTADGSILEWHAELKDLNHFNYLIEYMKRLNFDYVFFWYEGNKADHGIEDEFLEWTKYRSSDWTLMGHILDRDGRCPVFHEQCVVLNLKQLEDDFDLTYYDKEHGNFIASEEHVHDDYTPLWVKSAPGVLNRYQRPKSVLDWIMWNLLSQGHTVVNVPQSMRDLKECAYGDEDQEETIEWLLDDSLNEMTLEEGYELFKKVGDTKEILAECVLQKDVVYITNTDNTDIVFKPNVDTIICPASGLNQFMYAVLNIKTIKKMVWTDFSPLAIWWTKYILENWNGKDFKDFWFDHRDNLFKEANDPDLIETDYDKLDMLNDYFNELDDDIWPKIKDLEHVFLQIDLVKDYDKVLDIVKDSDVFLQTTNIFMYEANFIFNKYHKVIESFYSFVNKLVSSNKNVYFIGDTPHGRKYRYDPVNLNRICKF